MIIIIIINHGTRQDIRVLSFRIILWFT